jgi:hypothetical protein
MLFDGVGSCLRIYTPDEMKVMAVEAGGGIPRQPSE